MWTIIFICSFFIVLEAIGAYLSNSIAIFTDLIHLLSDLLGFLFSLLFVVLSTKKAPKEYTYGYIRAEIIGALCSVLIIWIMSIWIAIESINRLIKILKHQPVRIISALR